MSTRRLAPFVVAAMLALAIAVPALGEPSDDITVSYADALWQRTVGSDQDLNNTLANVRSRVTIQYANHLLGIQLAAVPGSFEALLDQVSARVAVQYANATIQEGLTHPKDLLGDTTPPQITNIGVSPVGSSSVNITWTTDEFATSAVDYGTQLGTYPNRLSDGSYTKQHGIVISSLAPNTTYYFLVSSADQSGNIATSSEQTFSTALHIAKSVVPEGQVDYGDELTYSVVIWTMLGTQAGVYDPLEGVSFLHFVQQPGDVTCDDGVITGTLTVPSGYQTTVSFVARVDVPGTEGETVTVTNEACVYPSSGTIEGDCVWSNEVTNKAFRPYELYLPATLRSY